MLIKPLLLGVLETALREYLALDKNSDVFLAPLQDKVIAVTLTPFNETVYLCPTPDSIQLLDQYPNQPDTYLTGSLPALGLMGLSSKPMRSLFSGDVKIEGDLQTGRKFQELFAKLDINLEGKLARYTGERVAHNISQFFRSGQSWGKESIDTFALNASEFLQEETRELPPAPEMDIFYRQVDELRTDFDRLCSRIERLEKVLANKPDNI
ncbi:MAG: SCP2 sterol-binding domain-containing protein [Methylovulum sp.]|nr:SCP2 sterol-binding domain-containing protein [Methylovulum sp.]